MSAIEDYLGTTEKPHSTNKTSPHAGNGAGDKPPTDPDTFKILEARRKAMAEPRKVLSPIARVCFTEILDRALNPQFFIVKGVVAISDRALASIVKVCVRTIRKCKRQLDATDYLWRSITRKTNMWPMTTYHVAALHKKPTLRRTDRDGTYGDNKTKVRPPPERPLGVRKTKSGRFIAWLSGPLAMEKRLHELAGSPLSEALLCPSAQQIHVGQELTVAEGRNLPLTTAGIYPSEGQESALENGRNLPFSTAEKCPSQGQKTSVANGKVLPSTTAQNCHLERDSDSVNGSLETASNAVNRVTALEGALKEGKLDWGHNWHQENNLNHFLDLCREVMGRHEVDDQPNGKLGNGGMWTKNFRRDAECRAMCWQVLRNARMKKSEGFQPATTWAQYVTDDWIRTAGAKAREKRR